MGKLILQLLGQPQELGIRTHEVLIIFNRKNAVVAGLLQYGSLVLIPLLVELEPEILLLLVCGLDRLAGYVHHALEVLLFFRLDIALFSLRRKVKEFESVLHQFLFYAKVEGAIGGET